MEPDGIETYTNEDYVHCDFHAIDEYIGFTDVFELQILDRNGEFTKIYDLSSYWSPVDNAGAYIDIFLYRDGLLHYIDCNSTITLRTVKRLLNKTLSTYTVNTDLYFLPKYPYNQNVQVVVDSTKSNPIELQIPKLDATPYQITLTKHTGWGFNFDSRYLPVNSSGAYVISNATQSNNTTWRGLDPIFYDLDIEYVDVNNFKCPLRSSFFIPEINYGFKETINGRDVHVKKAGDQAEVTLTFSYMPNEILPTFEIKDNGSVINPIRSSKQSTRFRITGAGYANVSVTEYNMKFLLTVGEHNLTIVPSTENPVPVKIKMNLNAPDPISFDTPQVVNFKCNSKSIEGETKGTISITGIKGGIGNYYYKIDGGSYTSISGNRVDAEISTLGEHTITIADSYTSIDIGYNTKTYTFNISEPAIITANAGITKSTLSCSNDGAITLNNVQGGAGNYQYAFDGGGFQSSNVLTNLISGSSHAYKIKDANGCVVQESSTLGVTPPLAIRSYTPIAPVNCCSQGSIEIIFNNRVGTLNVEMESPDASMTTSVNGDKVTITGNANTKVGRIKVTDSNNGSSCTIKIKCTGTTYIEADDTRDLTIPNFPEINAYVSSFANVANYDEETGVIKVSIGDVGSCLYTYQFYDQNYTLLNAYTKTNTSEKEQIFDKLSGANPNGKKYYIKITSGSCEKELDWKIYSPPSQLALVAEETTPIDCHGNATGVVTLTPSGGWGEPFKYSNDQINWQTSNQFTKGVGTHTFYVKDSGKGISSTQITLTEPAALNASFDGKQDVQCKGTDSGWLKYAITGGTAPYYFTTYGKEVNEHTEAIIQDGKQYLTAKKLIVGDYQLTIKDDRGCECAVQKQTLSEPEELKLIIDPTQDVSHILCAGETNGTIQCSFSGGTSPYTVDVLNLNNEVVKTSGKLTANSCFFEGMASGNYILKVTDNHNCFDNSSMFSINAYTNPIINSLNTESAKCYKESSGIINNIEIIYGTSGEVSQYYCFSNNMSQNNGIGVFQGLPAGDYKVYVEDKNNCSSNRIETSVNQPTAPLSVGFAPTTPVSAKSSATGVISGRISGGNGVIKNIWLQDFKQTEVNRQDVRDEFAFRIDSLYAGKYMLRAIDVKGCNYQSDSLEVIEPEKALSFKVTEREDALCKAPTGKFTVEANGGWEGIYSYKLSAGSSYGTMQSQNGLRAGSYLVSVKDRMGAVYTDTVIIYEPKDSLMVKLKDQVLPTCGNNGAITVDVTGGTEPYRLVFDTQKDTTHLAKPQSTSFLNRPAGAYVLKTIDGNGCRFDMDTKLDSTRMLSILSLDPLYPNPTGGACGLYANTRGGVLPLQYEWSNSSGVVMQQKTQILADVPTVSYSLKVTDALGCSQKSNGYLPSLADLPLTIDSLRGETDYEKHDGFVVLKSPLKALTQVDWMDSENVSHSLSLPANSPDVTIDGERVTLSSLKGGRYTIVVTDIENHKAYVAVAIDAYQKFDFLKEVTISHVQQPGETNGTITAEVTGGVAPYRFTWFKPDAPDASLIGTSDGSRGSLSDIGKGMYQVEVIDKYNNSITKQVEVLEPASKLTLQVNQYAHESCRDTVDAWVELKASGGWGDYQFRHDDEKYYSNSSSRQKLVVRTHDFYLVDRLGVETRVSHLVTEPEYLRARVSLIDSVNCHGNSDGNIFFDITGGTAPYKFVYDSIPNAWVHDTVARDQPARDYRFFLSDSHDCVSLDTLSAQLRQPDELLFSLQDVTHTTCNTNNGKINVALKGGTRPYCYQWTNFDNQTVGNDSTISGLVQGALYRLEVLDKYDCRQQWTQTINPSTLPEVTTVSTTDVICYGEATGTATVTGVVPAVPYAPYSFKWSNDSTGTSANGFYAGINHVVITDTNQCTTTKYFEVATPDTLSLRVAAFKDAHCFGYNDGYVEVEPRGGVGGYRYAWSNGETLPRASNLIKGDYLLTLTDDNDCVITHNYTIDEPEKLLVDLGDDIRICPGNSFRLDGQAFTTHQWANYTGVISNERFVSVNDECDYYLQVTNAIGCFAHDTINLSIGNDALQAGFLMTSEAPKNDTLMIFELSNLELDSLRWEYEPEAFNDITGATAADYILNLKTLKNGIYNVSLWAYSGGCVANAVKQVEIIDGNDSIPSDGILGYKDPLIKSMVVAPNPNDGKFTLNIELREEADINVVVYSVDYGVKIDTRSDKNLRNYELNYQLGGLNTGVYVIMLTAENERRQVKMVIK
jgi:hypothetical protein